MYTEAISGVIGVVCLGMASLAAFLMVPARELTARERIGIHTFYWTFAIFSMWTIYTMVSNQGWEKYFYVGIPFMLGLILSSMSEYQSKQPPINISDPRLKKLADKTWYRLPNGAKKALQSTIMNIQEVPEWSDLDAVYHQDIAGAAAKWFPLLPLPARGLIHISNAACKNLSDQAIVFSLVHALVLAYQSTRTPFDTNAIEKAGQELPLKWKFYLNSTP
ncbi:MAG: hypothetical protein NTZ34_14070 [Chloroflexi bacterium]|nr:hypothetical protein [Chloroflexota bacterium]